MLKATLKMSSAGGARTRHTDKISKLTSARRIILCTTYVICTEAGNRQ